MRGVGAVGALRQPCLLSRGFPFAPRAVSGIVHVVAGRKPHSSLNVDCVASRSGKDAGRSIASPRPSPDGADRIGRSQNLSRMPTSNILRSLLLGVFFTSPILFKPGFAILQAIAKSRSPLLSPDKNPLLKAAVKPLIYDQFCAGTNRAEICRTREMIKNMGFSGVILCYGRETQVAAKSSKTHTLQYTSLESAHGDVERINQWRDGNIKTVDMIGAGDWIGIKCTGAGPKVTEALLQSKDPPQEFINAMGAVCENALVRDCRVWIDAEHQAVQAAIDRLTIDLMRRYNNRQPGTALVYNTIQAYLKGSRIKLRDQLARANREGWTLGVKLVRGAYIRSDPRNLIHDTKEETDQSYNGIVRDLLSGTNLGFDPDRFPQMQLFLAGHNPHSVAAASRLIHDLAAQKRLKVIPDFGQLQGMADELGCELLQHCGQREEEVSTSSGARVVVPKVYKCLHWGSVQECMQYLVRRVVENRGGADRMRDGMSGYVSELKRRMSKAVTWR